MKYEIDFKCDSCNCWEYEESIDSKVCTHDDPLVGILMPNCKECGNLLINFGCIHYEPREENR